MEKDLKRPERRPHECGGVALTGSRLQGRDGNETRQHGPFRPRDPCGDEVRTHHVPFRSVVQSKPINCLTLRLPALLCLLCLHCSVCPACCVLCCARGCIMLSVLVCQLVGHCRSAIGHIGDSYGCTLGQEGCVTAYALDEMFPTEQILFLKIGTVHSVGFVLIRAADFSVKSAQAPLLYRQAKTKWRGSDRLAL